MAIFDFSAHAPSLRLFKDIALKQISETRGGQSVFIPPDSDDSVVTVGHLGYFFFLRMMMLVLHSSRESLVFTGELHGQVLASLEAVEKKTAKLGIMSPGGIGRTNWTACKAHVLRFIDVTTSCPDLIAERKVLYSNMEDLGNMLAADLRHKWTENHSELFMYVSLTRILLAMTNSKRMPPQRIVTLYLNASFALPVEYFSEKYMESVERTRSRLVDFISRVEGQSSERDVAEVFQEVYWQNHNFLEEFCEPVNGSRTQVKSKEGRGRTRDPSPVEGDQIRIRGETFVFVNDPIVLIGHMGFFLFTTLLTPIIHQERETALLQGSRLLNGAEAAIERCTSMLQVMTPRGPTHQAWIQCKERISRYLDASVSVPEVWREKEAIDRDLRSFADLLGREIHIKYSESHSEIMYFTFLMKQMFALTSGEFPVEGKLFQDYLATSFALPVEYLSPAFTQNLEKLRNVLFESPHYSLTPEQGEEVVACISWQVQHFLMDFRRPDQRRGSSLREKGEEKKADEPKTCSENSDDEEEKAGKVDLPKAVVQEEGFGLIDSNDGTASLAGSSSRLQMVRPLANDQEENSELTQKEGESIDVSFGKLRCLIGDAETVADCQALNSKVEDLIRVAQALHDKLSEEFEELQSSAVGNKGIPIVAQALTTALEEKRAQLEKASDHRKTSFILRNLLQVTQDKLEQLKSLDDFDCDTLLGLLKSIAKAKLEPSVIAQMMNELNH
eukprot:m.157173 g.157173  ORF g.157173 m.157173 type:complete len:729 (+) comp38704_c0_seq2:413-2599(+)